MKKAKSRKARAKEADDGGAATRPAGDEASAGDDATATSGISDADLDIEIDFFEGIDAQIGNNGAAPALC